MASSQGQPDMSLLAELLEIIEQNPPAIEARKLLVQQYLSAGWDDAAKSEVETLSALAPSDPEVKSWRSVWQVNARKPVAKESSRHIDQQAGPSKSSLGVKPAILPDRPDQMAHVKQDFIQDLINLKLRATRLLRNTKLLGSLGQQTGRQFGSVSETEKLQAIAEGKLSSALRLGGPVSAASYTQASLQPRSVRAVARDISKETPEQALSALLMDFESIIEWSRSKTDPPNNDGIRETLVKRVKALQACLPEQQQTLPSAALMHMEHEQLERNYVNDETMLGDAVAEIERASFFASEDNYAWDMSELAQAIKSNGGVMRNPLSRDMFSKQDIRFMVKHPMGKSLAAMQVEQSKLSKGIRPQTIEEMTKLATVLLDDQSADQIPSRQAIDLFFAYTATLPEAEQTALDKLKVPAKDSHTGQAYDGSIGESLKDALGNRTCMHKTGDFIKQAANHLRKR